jgi:purine-binding chemotaxis protein CheW
MAAAETKPLEGPVLLARARGRMCALPLACVVETMRPLPVTPLAGAPAFVRGLAVIRGEAVPVVDLAALLFGPAVEEPTRFVTLRVGDRRVALATGEVVGVRALPTAGAPLPPLLDGSTAALAALGRLDGALLLVLEGARLLEDAPWEPDGRRA